MIVFSAEEKNTACAELGRHLPKLRELLHMSQTDFGDRCGISKPRLSVIENGHHLMSWTQFTAIVLLCVFNRKAKEYLCRNNIITIGLLQYFQQCDGDLSPDFNTGIDKETVISSRSAECDSTNDTYLLMAEREQILNSTSKDTLFDYDMQKDLFRYSYTDDSGTLHSELIEHYLRDERYKETVHPDSLDACVNVIRTILESPASGDLEYKTRLSYNGYRWNRLIYKSITGSGGKVTHVYGRIENLHELISEKSDAKIRATLDLMTGTLNKVSAQEAISEILSSGVVKESVFLMIDIDNLKHINDTNGHIWGDNALIQFSKLLQRVFSAEDIIGRFGGDEFVVYMRNITIKVAENKIELFRKLLAEQNGDTLTCSIGGVYIHGKKLGFDEVLKLSDSAMYKIKNSGKNGYLVRIV